MKRFFATTVVAVVGIAMTVGVGTAVSAQVFTPAQVFATPVVLPAPSAMAKTSTESTSVLSCSSAGNCLAPVKVTTKSGLEQAYVTEERSGTWSPAHLLLLPLGLTSQKSSVYAVDCLGPGNCVVVGTDRTGGFSATETNFVWARGIQLPGLLGFASVLLTSISCPSLSNCVATGMGLSSAFSTSPVIATETDGVWEIHELLLPTDAVTGFLVFNGIFGVSCTAVGECTAVGTYSSVGGLVDFSVSQQAGLWGPVTPLALPSDADLSAGTSTTLLTAVHCTAPGECSAAGAYPLQKQPLWQTNSTVPFVISETGGIWGMAQRVRLPAGAFVATRNVPQASEAGGISCTDPDSCLLVGTYSIDAKGRTAPFTAQVTNGVSQRATQLPVPADAKRASSASVGAVSCIDALGCVVTGNYTATTGIRPFAAEPATMSGAPTILKTTSKGTVLAVVFKAPMATGGLPVLTYDFSVDGGTTWIPRPQGTTSSPLLIPGVVKNTKYSVSIRAVTAYGPSQASLVVMASIP